MILSQFIECSHHFNKGGGPNKTINIAYFATIHIGTFGEGYYEKDWHYIQFLGERDVYACWYYPPEKIALRDSDYQRILNLNKKP